MQNCHPGVLSGYIPYNVAKRLALATLYLYGYFHANVRMGGLVDYYTLDNQPLSSHVSKLVFEIRI